MTKAVPHRGTAFIHRSNLARICWAKSWAALKSSSFGCTAACLCTPVNIFTDQDAAWLETNDNVRWLKGNKYFTWESERDCFKSWP